MLSDDIYEHLVYDGFAFSTPAAMLLLREAADEYGLVAVTEVELAKNKSPGETPLQ